jgi:hypothetical protein
MAGTALLSGRNFAIKSCFERVFGVKKPTIDKTVGQTA